MSLKSERTIIKIHKYKPHKTKHGKYYMRVVIIEGINTPRETISDPNDHKRL